MDLTGALTGGFCAFRLQLSSIFNLRSCRLNICVRVCNHVCSISGLPGVPETRFLESPFFKLTSARSNILARASRSPNFRFVEPLHGTFI